MIVDIHDELTKTFPERLLDATARSFCNTSYQAEAYVIIQQTRWVAMGAIAISAAAAIYLAIASANLPGSPMTPFGVHQTTSLYVRMRDGVKIAVTIFLPPDLQPGERVPVLMRTTRYWRNEQAGWGLRVMIALHLSPSTLLDDETDYFTRRRFAVVVADARGTGASGGHRVVEFAPEEVADIGELATWAAREVWSNGRVGTFGVSYDGNTAELAAATGQPAIRAVMPQYSDFDPQALIQPGGVALCGFIDQWSQLVAALDRDDVCGVDDVRGWTCWRDRQMTAGVQRVDADLNGDLLADVLAEHRNINIAEALRKVEFRDDELTKGSKPIYFSDISPFGMQKQIEASGVPMMIWCGWLDADSCQGALIRYRTFANPQRVIIGPLSHGGSFNVDPFGSKHLPPIPAREEQLRMEADFFDRVLRNPVATPVESSITYYTMGEGRWHSTSVWPPKGLTTETLYFTAGRALKRDVAATETGSDSYRIDYSISSGSQTRWQTQLGGGDVVYPDRTMDDGKLLSYTSDPLTNDLEITGSPVLTLSMTSSESDGAVHAFLEDVGPTGRVTYLDEGELRLIDRKEVEPNELPYEPLGPPHSFLRKDAEPMRPGEIARIRLALLPTSVLIRKGHAIRISIAGADEKLFQRYPAAGQSVWTVYHESQEASFLELPVRGP